LNRSLPFAVAAIPIFTFCLEVMMRRAAEFAGFAPNAGVCLSLAVTATCVPMVAVAEKRGGTIFGIGVLLAATASFAAVGFHHFPDNGFDAQSYHLPSELRLLAGWKAMVERTDLMLSNSYPSGIWTVLAGFDAIFGFESGRSFLLMLMTSAFAVTWSVLRRAGVSAAASFMMSSLLVANPVALSQMFTALSDGAAYELALILLCGLLLMLENRDTAAALFAGATMILLCNAKLSGPYFAALALAICCGLFLLRLRSPENRETPKDRRAQIVVLVVAGVLAVGFAGWRPYVTNVLDHHSVMYPLPSELGYKPGNAGQVPPNLDGAGRAAKIAALIFARTDMDGGPTQLKLPGTFAWHEFRMASDTRNGGFGPLFGAAILLAFGALAWAFVSRARWSFKLDFRLEALLGLTAYGVVTTALFPEPWWARFVPLAWLTPLGASWIAWELRSTKLVGACAVGVAALLSVNSAVAGYDAVTDGLAYAHDIEQKLDRMAGDPNPVYLSRGTLWNPVIGGQHAAEDVWRRRLYDRGKFDVRIVPRERCRELEFLSVDVSRCAPPLSQ
jgi:hypothetical protein